MRPSFPAVDGKLTGDSFKVPAPRNARNLGLSMYDTSVKYVQA